MIVYAVWVKREEGDEGYIMRSPRWYGFSLDTPKLYSRLAHAKLASKYERNVYGGETEIHEFKMKLISTSVEGAIKS